MRLLSTTIAAVLLSGGIVFGQADKPAAKAKAAVVPPEIDPKKPYAAPDRPKKVEPPKYMETKDATFLSIPVNRPEIALSLRTSPLYDYSKHRDYPGEFAARQNSPFHDLMFRPSPLYQTTPYYDRGIAKREVWDRRAPPYPPTAIPSELDSAPTGDYTPYHNLVNRPSPLYQTTLYYDWGIAKRDRWHGSRPMHVPPHHYFENDNLFVPMRGIDRRRADDLAPYYSGVGGTYRPGGSYVPGVKSRIYTGY